MTYQREPFPFNAGRLGQIEGLTVTSASPNQPPASVRYFGGLPYGLPPVGQAPRPLPRHYKYGTTANPGRFTGGTAICPQPPNRNPPDPSLFNEDCLQLNIWTPTENIPAAGWPVLFYLHGGYLQWGSANWKREAPVPLLNDSVFRAIIVVPAYRLNALGFLPGQELADEAKTHGQPVGNMGLWDQRTALEWTRDNIAVFGGDPTNVTVAGYSAGAFSAFHQLATSYTSFPPQKVSSRESSCSPTDPACRPRLWKNTKRSSTSTPPSSASHQTWTAKQSLQHFADSPSSS
jgi:carboxylesterase type B